MDTPTDAAVIAAVLAGDTNAFAILVQRYRDSYARYAIRMLGSRDDAEDALQAAFVRAFRALRQCAEPTRFGAWLYQIVINECRTLAMRRGRRERRILNGDAELARALQLDESPNDDAVLREDIQRALDRLPADQREAFVLKYIEDRSYEEMAELTGAGVSALKMRVKRACDRLRELLEEVYDA